METKPTYHTSYLPNGYVINRVTVQRIIPLIGVVQVFSVQVKDIENRVIESIVTTDPIRGQGAIDYWTNKQ